jgi:hypothetical protein
VQLIGTERSETGSDRVASTRVHRLALRPLRTTQLYPLVEAILGRMPSPELVGWIERHSQGVPLMVRELSERVAAEGESLVDVPRIAHRIFSHRFEQVDAASRVAMGIAALCGIRFDAPLVEAAAGDVLPADRAWIRDGIAAGILVAVRDHPLRFAFRHTLLREAAEGLLASERVAGWHQRIAEAIERQRPEPSGAVLSQLARHSAAAAVEHDDVARPLGYALLAARRAARVLDWAEVGVHASHVLTWIEFVPPTPERDRHEVEATLLRCAAIAYSTGHVEETEALLERIGVLLAREQSELMRGVAEGFHYANARCLGDYERARAAAEAVSALEGLDSVADCWRTSLAVVAGDFETTTQEPGWGAALPADPRFHEFARLCGRDPGIDRLGHTAFAFWARGDDALAVATAERAVAWAGDSGDVRGRIWALFLLCLLHEMRRDWAELRRVAPEIDQATARSGVSPFLGVGAGLRMWAEAREKDEPGPGLRPLAEVLLDRARATSTSLTTPLLLLASRIFTWTGDFDAAERSAREGITWAERTGERMVVAELQRQLAQVLLRSGDPDTASAPLLRGVEIARAQGHRVSETRGLRDRLRAGRATPEEIARLEQLEASP